MKRFLSLLVSLALVISLAPSALAASNEAVKAANALYEQGLFNGTGTDATGNPNFDLDRAPTRHEAVTMLVRLLGKENEAQNGTWTIPFTDVAAWAKPYVGYAYANGLTTGTSPTTYDGDQTITASQYLTFVLRALGYQSGTDFQWDKAWELSDKIRLTNGQYNADSANFTRGDVAVISCNALSIRLNGKNQTLMELVKQNDGTTPPETVQVTSDTLQGIWRKKVTDPVAPGGEAEIIFSGDNITYADYSDNTTMYESTHGYVQQPTRYVEYREGTYQVDGNQIISTCQWQANSNYGRDWGNGTVSFTFVIDELSKTSMTIHQSKVNLNDNTSLLWYISTGTYEKVENDAVTTIVANAVSNKISTPTTPPGSLAENFSEAGDFTYLAGNSFRMIRDQYPTATGLHAYVTVYTNLDGHLCVLTDVWYKIIRNYNEVILYDITENGRVIFDPQNYYEDIIDRQYGASKLHYMDMLDELLGHLVEERQNGAYVSGEELNQLD